MPLDDLDKDKFARSFGPVADSYASARPDYPAEATDWLIRGEHGPGSHRVLELGSGTGLLTRALVSHELLATDPSAQMLARLHEALPGVPAAVARAEQIPLPAHTVDVVVAAQAFHWFDHEAALPEIARVLRPDGHLALVWNVPDEGTPWVRKLQRIVPRPTRHEDDVAPLLETPWFTAVEIKKFRTWKQVDKQRLLELVRSRSPFAVADQPTREQMLADVAALYDDYDRGSAGMALPYITYCYRAVVQPPSAVPRRPAPRPGARRTTDPAPAPGDPTSEPSAPADQGETTPPVDPPEDDGTLLIDFR